MKAKATIEISDLVLKSAGSLEERLADLISTMSGNEIFTNGSVEPFAVHNLNGFSGYNFWVDGVLIGQLHLASLSSGYYVFKKRVFIEGGTGDIYDYYNQEGEQVYSGESLDGTVTWYNSINMDPTNACVNHLYNVLCVNYEAAENGIGDSQRIAFLEKTLNSLMRNPKTKIGANAGRRDPALINIYNEVHRIEADPILNWDERQRVYSSLKQVRRKILRTKSRAHKFNMFTYNAPVSLRDAQTKLELFKKRPVDNIFGVFKKYTWGRLVWFGRTVQGNLGLSIAMAIYGPFTFYFITQPMNPHAMWAVGKVRGAYLDFVEGLSSSAPKKKPTLIADANALEDSVSVKSSGIQKQGAEKAQTWDDRMSSFKALQIAYEESMVFAARMGRLEHMENQFLFPLTAEAAWEEMERYLADIEAAIQYNSNLDSRYKAFLEREKKRTLELQVYIWKKLSRFFNDHPYMVVDQDDEQEQKDYYTGRGFVFMKKMTDKLSKLDLSSTPATHKKVAELAGKYEKLKVDGDGIIDALKKNSKIFAQSDIYDTGSLRSKLKRHWEVLFLQQTKKQEASTFGLQMYTWSVRNAIWILQSITSAKRQDIASLTYKYNLNNQGTDSTSSDGDVNALHESMMNMLVLEFTSIKAEIAQTLEGDKESELRIQVIENLKSYMNERDRLFNNGTKMANDSERDSVTI